MKRFVSSLVAGLALVAVSAVPVFADDENGNIMPPQDPAAWCAEHPSDPGCSAGSNGSNYGSGSGNAEVSGYAAISTPVDLSAWFSAEGLAFLSVDDQKILADKLNALAPDPAAFKKKVDKIQEWLNARLREQNKKMQNEEAWESKLKVKFEMKVDAQFEKLMLDKKAAMERAREERMKKMQEKRARMEAARARRLAQPKILQAWIDSVDSANGVILLKKNGAQAKVLVNAKTVIVVIEDDGAKVGSLADFQAGDRIFGLVRRNPNDQSLVGVVLVKMQAHGADDEEDDEEDRNPAAWCAAHPSDPGCSGNLPDGGFNSPPAN